MAMSHETDTGQFDTDREADDYRHSDLMTLLHAIHETLQEMNDHLREVSEWTQRQERDRDY